LGREQARCLGERLSGAHFDRFIASDLSRASDTARAVGPNFTRDPAFREFDVGAWEGLTRDEVEQRFPGELASLKNGEDVALGGGESFITFSARIGKAFEGLLASLSPGEHALVVCHGGVIGTLLGRLLGLRDRGRFPIARVPNTSITELEISQDAVCLRVFNDTLHLLAHGGWPNHPDATGLVALMTGDEGESPIFGSFAARYDARPGAQASEHARFAQSGAADAVDALLALHEGARVGVHAEAYDVHTWMSHFVFGDEAGAATLARPVSSTVCHIGKTEHGMQLFDYGVSAVRSR